MIIDKWMFGEDFQGMFIGVVESRLDPMELGRVKVRVFGVHNPSLTEIPSDDLPWATVVQPAGGKSFSTPKESDVVIGFWLDGAKQLPCVIGVIPGIETNPPNTGSGFHDLRPQSVIANSPKTPVGRTYNTDGSGIVIAEANTANATVLESLRHPTAQELNQPTIPAVARYQNLANTVIAARKSNLDLNIPTANGGVWSEPYPAYNPEYPYDNATQTESGHVFELDDTPGSERVHIAHRSGSYVEWFPTGSQVEKITRSRYTIVMADDHLHVMGTVFITVDGDILVRANGDVVLEAGGSLSVNVAGDTNFSVGGNFNLAATNINLAADSDTSLIGDTAHVSATEELDLTGSTINIDADETLNLLGGTLAALQAAEVGITGGVQIQGLESVNEGAPSASGGTPGEATGLPGAISSLSKSTGRAPPEAVPVPYDIKVVTLDSYTGQAYNQAQYLVPGANNSMVAPDANTPANTSNCSYDPTQHTFLAQPWTISDNGIAFIQAREGFAKVTAPDTVTAYPDPATGSQPYTIGYGSTSAGIDQPVTLGELISRATAQSYLEYNINVKVIPYMAKYITVQLTQNMVDALCSLIYNIGVGGFAGSTVLKQLNQSNWCAAANAILLWSKAAGQVNSGLASRRQLERNLFLS